MKFVLTCLVGNSFSKMNIHFTLNRWSRTLTATNLCTGSKITSEQIIQTHDICPANACGRNSNPPQGICISGKCSCNKPFYGDDCQTSILEPRLDEENFEIEIEEGQDFAFQPKLIEGKNPINNFKYH